jgi:alpha-ketoglutarate-dependent taurine dioxygenase
MMSKIEDATDLPGPFKTPAAWRGAELLDRDDWQYRLRGEDLDEIDLALQTCQQSGRPIEQATTGDFPLPELSRRLQLIQHRLEHGSGACMITGLDPQNYDESQLRRIFWGIATHLGTPVSQSATGERIFSVRDEGFREGQAQARGPNTRKRLSFHTDRCDVIGFLCLEQAESGGDNQLVSSVTLFNEMRTRWPESAQVLMQPFWYKRHNVDTENPDPYCQQPIFSYYDGYFAASYLRVLIDRAYAMPDLPDLSEEQLLALDRLETLAGDPVLNVTFRQRPGDLVFLNNWVTFHRRDEFTDGPTGQRHLLRVWLAAPNSRPLDPLFKANYGATEAGAIRGGMTAADNR